MSGKANDNYSQDAGSILSAEKGKLRGHAPGQEAEPKAAQPGLKEAAYVILFIAAVFVVNAMETGSYRTPWPVAMVTLLAGLGLYGYAHVATSSEAGKNKRSATQPGVDV